VGPGVPDCPIVAHLGHETTLLGHIAIIGFPRSAPEFLRGRPRWDRRAGEQSHHGDEPNRA